MPDLRFWSSLHNRYKMNFLQLFFYRPFLGVNTAQFFDTLGNNFLRNAITAAVIFGVIKVNDNTTVSSLMVGILMLPSFLFMATAGEIADKYPKDAIIKTLKILQLITAILAGIGFCFENIWLLMLALFLMGTFAAFLSTAKYSILPDILPQNNLLAANGIMQMTVFLAIFGGTILGGTFFSPRTDILYAILAITSITGALFAFIIPHQISCAPNTIIHKNPLTAIRKNISFVFGYKKIICCIGGISWFWFVGTFIISLVPAFTKEVLNGNSSVFTLFIVIFTVGLSLGTILCQILLKCNISTEFIRPCLAVIALSLLDLAHAAANYATKPEAVDIKNFLTEWQGLHIAINILIFSIAGGVYIVPLTTMLQVLSPKISRAKIIAANNIINAFFMIVGSGFCALLLLINAKPALLFTILAILNAIAFIVYKHIKMKT